MFIDANPSFTRHVLPLDILEHALRTITSHRRQRNHIFPERSILERSELNIISNTQKPDETARGCERWQGVSTPEHVKLLSENLLCPQLTFKNRETGMVYGTRWNN